MFFFITSVSNFCHKYRHWSKYSHEILTLQRLHIVYLTNSVHYYLALKR